MSSKKWCITFLVTLAIIIASYALFNMLIDPFGVFGDKIFNWYSYDITNNPRAAKIAYLEKDDNFKKYDSYLIGCSSTSSFPKESLDSAFGGNWYNMIMYGADMLDVEQTVYYVVDKFDAKNIMINVFISNAQKYDVEENNITSAMHAKLNGENIFKFYSRYAFLDPNYSLAKIDALKKDTYLTQPFDVFNVETGAYDKKVRDAESIGTLKDYYKKYEFFENYPMQSIEMTEIENTVKSIKRIDDFCKEKNVKITYIMAPVYVDYLKYFTKNDIAKWHEEVSKVIEYWDFTRSSLTYEPRFFYDENHFRNALGKMCIAKMVEDKNVYYPEDIGTYVTKANVQEHINYLLNIDDLKVAENENDYIKNLPVLTLHSISENPQEITQVSKEKFEDVLKVAKEKGYKSVSLSEVYAYIYKGVELPEKPYLITFDDGYLNNYTDAFDILKKYEEKATIFSVGATFGSDGRYKDTDKSMEKHFGINEAKEMIQSGLVDVQSHTFNMHEWKPYEIERGIREDKIRENILKLDGETEEEYIKFLNQDLDNYKELEDKIGGKLHSVAFPSGLHDTLSDVILSQYGILSTFTIDEGTNWIIKGLPQSLYNLKRNNITQETDLEALFDSF